MNPLKKLPALLVIALGLAVGCGDDGDDDNGNNNGNDAGNGGEDAGTDSGGGGDVPGPTTECNGLYVDLTFKQMLDNVEDTGACIADVQVGEVCTTNPSSAAATAGKSCFVAGRREAALVECTIEGEGEGDDAIKGLRATSPELSDACLTCYAAAVACSAANCAGACLADSEGQACLTCRETKPAEAPCNPTFYECSGLPRPEDLKD